MDLIPGILWGITGSALVELHSLYGLRKRNRLPAYISTKFFWIMTILMILAGGLIVAMYIESGASLSPFMAVNLGGSAPLIIKSLSDNNLPNDPGSYD